MDLEAIKSILRRHAAALARDGFEGEWARPGERADFLRGIEKLSDTSDPSVLAAGTRDLFIANVTRANAKRHDAKQGAVAAIADYDQAIAFAQELRVPLGKDWPVLLQNELAGAYVQRGIAKQDVPWHGTPSIGDFDLAIALREELRSGLGAGWSPQLRNDLAVAYQARGAAKRSAPGYGVASALDDDDQAIGLMAELMAQGEALQPEWWNDLATAYINRGNAKKDDPRYGAAAAMGDYDRAVDLMERLRASLDGNWRARWRNDLASAYLNRGNARLNAPGQGALPAIADFDRAIALLKELRLPPGEAWTAEWSNDVARAYQNRGSVKSRTPEHGAAAMADYDEAIALREEARARAGENWPAPLRCDLANSYLTRGNAKRFGSAQGAAAAIADYDRAIALMEELRARAADNWLIPWRKDLADAYASRSAAKQSARYAAAAVIEDCDRAIALMEDLRATMAEDWSRPMCYALAHTYMSRGSSRPEAPGQRAAASLADYDRAIALMEGLRTAQLEDWPALWRQGLAVGYFLRAQTRGRDGDRAGACADAKSAEKLFLELVRFAGEGPWVGLAPRASALCKELCGDSGSARWSV